MKITFDRRISQGLIGSLCSLFQGEAVSDRSIACDYRPEAYEGMEIAYAGYKTITIKSINYNYKYEKYVI